MKLRNVLVTSALVQAKDRRKVIQTSHSLLRKRLSIVAAFLSVIVVFLVSTGCSAKLIGDYDGNIDSGVTEVQQRAELYLSKLESDPNTPYDQNFYDDMNARLAVLRTRAAALPKYPIIVEQLTNLKAQFADLQKLDKATTRPFPIAAATAAESAITVSVESILKLEIALKRGVTTPPALTSQ